MGPATLDRRPHFRFFPGFKRIAGDQRATPR